MSGLAELGGLWSTIQIWLFPMLEDELGELDDRHREFIAVCEVCALREHVAAYRWVGNGCPAARPKTAWHCARPSSPRPCGTFPPPGS